ncbi:hypothetical protein N4239_11890 [Brachyspira hyodysenteriae]|uniref:hypothetical protein n=1 Tax=Brachyspira hyodysenteriae TaxID=159 RepID=UPI002B259DC9|nr:hypothetical protein [Brachyspira hyodysenteriae]WPC23635.1 hypothetical protein N4239_11890 [Brachyspira hyodysenteriae]
MREVNFIENNGLFGITFKSDDKEEANTVMNAIQRFILKNSSDEKKENIDFSVCPIGEYKGTVWILINTISLKQYLSNYNLQEGYRNRVIEELKKRGEYIDDNNIEEVEKPIKEISRKTELKNQKKDIQKEIAVIENKSFEETLKENNEIISFSEDEEQSNYKIDEDPLSVDTDNINNWDFDTDGDKVDADGNKMLFDY